MISFLRIIICALAFTSIQQYSFALENPNSQESPSIPVSSEPVSVALISEQESLQPGKPSWVAISMSIDGHWHAYWKNPGDAGMAPIITWNLPEGFKVSEVQWPTPTLFNLSSAVGLGYEGKVVFLAQITPPASFKSSSPVEISADMRWVVCSDSTCLPGDETIALTLPVSNDLPKMNESTKDFFAEARARIPKKHDLFKAERKEKNSVTLTFEHNSSDGFHEAFFFPEEKKTIDYKTKITLTRSEDNPNHHSISLKEFESAAKASSLKGVLVLKTSTTSEAFDVNIQIEGGRDPSEISMSDKAIPSKGKADAATTITDEVNDDFSFKGGLLLALGFAFLGGMILNLMPCVLPVISLKVMSFVKLAGESRILIFRHGLAFSLGVLISFWTLAGALLVLQAYGRSVGWGFQLQEPIFVAILASGLLVFALSLFGLFEMGTSMISAAGNARKKKEGLSASFFSGILATAVATPCTGPFLGSAVGFAVTLPAPQALLIFTFLGLGMSFPYLLLAAFPQFLRFMPKAGNWMMAFKELMGFFMLATVLWLVWIFGAQTSNFALSFLLGGFFFMALACWIYGRWSSPLKPRRTRYISMSLAALIFVFGGYAVFTASSPWAEAMGGGSSKGETLTAYANDEWEEFSVERIAELRKQGIPVFVDFTAKWCLICQANHLILTTDEVNQQFNQKGVVKMKADWTKNDSVIAAELKKFGRNSVPLYVLYNGDEEEKPQILPQLLTPEIVVDSLKQL